MDGWPSYVQQSEHTHKLTIIMILTFSLEGHNPWTRGLMAVIIDRH